MSLLSNLLSRVGYVKYSNGDSFYKVGSTSFLSGANMEFALKNPVLFACIEIRAKALSKVIFYQKDSEGKKIFDTPILKRIENPNPHQSKQDFLKQYEWFKSVYGWVYQKPYYNRLDKEVKAIFNLSSNKIEFPKDFKSSIIFSNKDIREYNEQKISYKENEKLDVKTFELKEVLKFYDITNGLSSKENSNIISPCRIDTIIKSISNIGLSLDSENVMIQQNGREMYWSASGKSANLGTSMPMKSDDRKNIRTVLNNTGLGKGKNRAIIAHKEIGHKSLHAKLSELGLHDVIINNAELVRSVFEVPSEVYDAFTKNKTYENQKEATIGFYENTMQPIADDIASTYTNDFNLDSPLYATYDHLPIMQHNEERKANKLLKIAMAYEKLQRGGLSTEEISNIFTNQGINIEL